MARLIFGMLTSIDGYIAGAGPGHFPAPSDELHRIFNEQQRAASMSLYGRRMWEIMEYWGQPDPERGEVEEDLARAWIDTPKAVISSTLSSAPVGAQLISGDVVSQVRRLKDEQSGEIDVSGAELAASLGSAGLIDEYVLYVQPVVFGGGKPFFAGGYRPELSLIETQRLPQGVVMARYRAAAAH